MELKPCPICDFGLVAHAYRKDPGGWSLAVQCIGCDFRGPSVLIRDQKNGGTTKEYDDSSKLWDKRDK
jgi:hypothetical protein